MDHSLQLKYQRNYSIIINDCDVSLFYYFDYGERYKQINMEFQHSHRFHEIMIPLSPDAIHFIEGVPYSLEEGDIVLLPPTILHRTEYPAGPPSKRLIISFWYPKDLFGMTDYYLPLLSIFNAQTPIYRFPEEIRRQVLDIIDEIYTFSRIMTIWSTQNSGLLFTRCLYSFCMRFSKSGQKSIHKQVIRQLCNTKIYSIAYYIHSHYEEELSLDSLADKFFLSSCYLSHQFKKVTGFTLINYIQKVRILVQGIFCSQPTTLSLKLHSHVAFKAFLSLTEFSARLTISLHPQCAPAQRLLQVSSQMRSFNINFRLLRLALLTTCSQFQRYD